MPPAKDVLRHPPRLLEEPWRSPTVLAKCFPVGRSDRSDLNYLCRTWNVPILGHPMVRFSSKNDSRYKKILNSCLNRRGFAKSIKTSQNIPPFRVTHFIGRGTLYTLLQTV